MTMQTALQDKTKVIFIDQAVAFGGSIVVLAHLLKFLDHTRYSCLLVTAMPQEILDHLFNDGTRVVGLKPRYDYGQRTKIAGKFSWLGRHGRRIGAYCFTVLSFSGNIVYRYRLWRLLRTERPDIVHVNNNCTFSADVCALAGQSFVWHFHGPPNDAVTAWQRWTLSRAAKFISISDYLARTIQGYWGRHHCQPIEVIPNPAPQPSDLTPQQLDAVRQRWNIPARTTVIGIFGRLVAWKGQLEFLKAYKKVRAHDPNTVALIVGDASDLGENYETLLRNWVAENDLRDSVVFTGYCADVGPLYQVCDIVVHASIEPEPFGLVIVEAMSAGAAVIASKLGAGPEIIQAGVTGLTADPRSPDELANSIFKLLDDKELRRKVALAGKMHAREKYAPQRYAAAMDAVYQRVLTDTLATPDADKNQ
jgi:glycosyltransferase involved in cell wall biosynthesis